MTIRITVSNLDSRKDAIIGINEVHDGQPEGQRAIPQITLHGGEVKELTIWKEKSITVFEVSQP